MTNIIAFHSQQTIEKTFKAIIEEIDLGFIRTHNLERLYSLIESTISLEMNEQIIAELDRLYIDTRYPGDFGLMPHGKPSLKEAEEYYKEAKRIKDQVEQKLL